MARRLGAIPLLLLLAGCVGTDPASPAPPWQAYKITPDAGPDRILFDVALVQGPLEDDFLNRGVWAGADEMVLSPERRELLELNGYRVGVLVGPPPEPLLNLLRSPLTCLERRGRSVPSGAGLEQLLRESESPVECRLQLGRTPEAARWERPRFAIDLFSHLLENGKVRLRMTPRIEAGERSVHFKPVPEESKWALEVKRAGRAFTELAWEIDLMPNQVLLVGARLDDEDSAGYQSFVRPEGDEPMQRLLVVRRLRGAAAEVADAAPAPAGRASISSAAAP